MTQNADIKPNIIARVLILCAAGLISGTINGLLGTGGGIAVVFLLTKLYAKGGEYSTKDIFSMTVCVCFMMSAASCAVYYSGGYFTLPDVAPYILPAVFGGCAGALLLDKMNSVIFKKIFALLVIWAGISMAMTR